MSQKLKILVTRDIGEDAMKLITSNPQFEATVWPNDSPADPKWLLENIEGCSGLLCTLGDKVTEELIARAGRDLRVVSTMSVGYDHIDTQALRSRSIRLGYTPDVLTEAVADICVMLALMATRNVTQALGLISSGKWPSLGWGPYTLCGPQIGSGPTHKTSTVGFLGFGRISQATLARLAPFGVTHCIYTNSGRGPSRAAEDDALANKLGLKEIKRVELDTLATDSDILFTLAPGGPSTKHTVNQEFLRKMKKTSVLINPGRGPIVDTQALIKALKEEWIWGAGLDVIENEPNIPADHPLANEPRCVLLPHIGSATLETRATMAVMTAENLIGGLTHGNMPVECKLT